MTGSMRTPLSRVRGHGAAKSGTGHFIAERVTAVALLFLAPWFAIAAALSIRSFPDAMLFLTKPWNALGVILLIVVGAYHMMLGMQVIVEDYVSKPMTRAGLLLLNTFFCFLLAAIGVFAVLQINFGW
ncbi:MAG: succinate dehydrogenase, hydrophobic membrane anchor protein [Hyphomonadaceae bacterium]